MYFVDRTAVVIKPTEKFMAWLHTLGEDTQQLTLQQLQQNCTTLLVPQFDTPEEVVGYLFEHHRKIFEAEIASWTEDRNEWPKDMGLEAFGEFFNWEINDVVLDLMDGDIELSPVFDD